MDERKGNRCGIDNCRSRRYVLEDGEWVCSNGHVQPDRLDVQVEEDFQFKGDRRSVAPTESEANAEEKVFTGKKGLLLFLQAYQLLLRHQVRWLVNEKGFPAELELVIRDLWSIRTKAVIPNNDGQDSDDSIWSALQSQASSQASSSEFESLDNMTSGGEEGSQPSQSSASQTTRKRKRSRMIRYNPPRLVFSACICYIGMILVRCPVTVGDMQKWIYGQEFPYMLAFKVLPKEMLDRMDNRYRRVFVPEAAPRIDKLHTYMKNTILYYKQFSVTIPALNYRPILISYIERLGLPLEMYYAVKNLMDILSVKFSFDFTKIERLRLPKHPEVELVALLVIATKLCYGLDDIDRYSSDKSEVANIIPEWQDWKAILKSQCEKGRWEVNLDEGAIYDMDTDSLDKYMAWYEESLYAEKSKTASKQILELYKVSSDAKPDDLSDPDLNTLMQSMSQNSHSNNKASGVQHGDKYSIYTSSKHLPEKLKLFMDAAASMIALSAEQLVPAVRLFENECLLWISKKDKPLFAQETS